ncbi:MAG: GUN4 domain-containing protein, partial [Okeania sp. SIO2H7]|nr:GUN4 domain-containing protein [Okeania sp. SIO2H7]
QTPYAVTEPANKLHLILLINQATQADITLLKNHAWRAEINENFEVAKQFWIRVNIAAKGSDADAIAAFQRFKNWPNSSSQEGKSSTKDSKTILEEELKSLKGIDYRKLRDLLSNKQFEDGDLETWHLICQVALRRKEKWLDRKSIQKLPYEDLKTINQLWIKYSNGLFGFSVQKRIYEESGGKWEEFAYRVGWHKPFNKRKWLNYNELNFQTNAPRGHFPAAIFRASEYFKIFKVKLIFSQIVFFPTIIILVFFMASNSLKTIGFIYKYSEYLDIFENNSLSHIYETIFFISIVVLGSIFYRVWLAKIKNIPKKTTSALLSRKDL